MLRAVLAVGLVLACTGRANAQPAPPLVRDMRVQLVQGDGPRLPVRQLAFASEVSPDTVTLEIRIEDRLGPQAITTTPDRTNLYRPALRLAPGKLDIEIVAVDAAGRRSTPNERHLAQATVRPPMNCIGPFLYIFLIAPIVLVALVLRALYDLVVRRKRVASQSDGELSLLVADHIARTVLRGGSSWSVAYAVGGISAWGFGHPGLAVLLGLCMLVPVSSVIAARRVARTLAGAHVRAELRGTLLVVYGHDHRAHLATTRRVIERARQQALPSSIVR